MLKMFDMPFIGKVISMLNKLNIELLMSFNEKSAWVMSVALLAGGSLYFGLVVTASIDLQELVSPTLPLLVVYTVVLVFVAIAGHVAAAVAAPGEASATLDERERNISSRASSVGSSVLAVGILLALGTYLLFRNGDLLFYLVFASLMMGQLVEYLRQVALYRVAL